VNYTEQQAEAITTMASHICVDAGAGSGKTRVLVDRIVHLLEQKHATLDQIVAITFTAKAAAEMKARLRAAFRDKAPHDDAELMNQWRDLERRVDTARVCTIHAFCAGFLRESALRVGLDPDFSLLTDAENRLLSTRVVTETLHRLLNQSNPSAVHLATELGISALTRVLESLLSKRDTIHELALTYPLEQPQTLVQRWAEEVDRERRRRLESLPRLPKVPRYLRALRSFHDACDNAEDGREQWRLIMVESLDAITQATTTEDIKHALSNLAQRSSKNGAKKNWDSEEIYKALDKLQKEIQSFARSYLEEQQPDTSAEEKAATLTCDLISTAKQVLSDFARAKAVANCLDYDDLIGSTRQALGDHENLRERTAADIRFLLMDEFQDTDHNQLEIARLLADCESGPDLFIVGDAKQSIYRFRGAEVGVFLQERKRAAKLLALDKNFRALPDVMAFVNDFFHSSALLAAVDTYQPMRTNRPPTKEQRIEFLIPEEPEGTRPLKIEDYRRSEAALLALRIRDLCADDAPPLVVDEASDTFRTARYGDMAILMRAMSDVHLYEAALRKAGIPYSLTAGVGFYKRQEVLDILNLLKILIDPWDEVALAGFLRSPLAGLSDDSLVMLTQDSQLVTALQLSCDAHTAIHKLSAEQQAALFKAKALLDHLRAHMELPVSTFLRLVLRETNLEAVLLSRYLGVQHVSNVRKLVEVAEDFAHRRPPTLRGFVQYLDDLRGKAIREGEAAMMAEGGGAVTLLTIHKSKGLEFPVVLLPDLGRARKGVSYEGFYLHDTLGMALKATDAKGEQHSPLIGTAITNRIKEETEAEDARVLYVALTRARDYLLLCGPSNPKAASWFHSLNEEYNICKKPHGTKITGDGWEGAVIRQAQGAAQKSLSTMADSKPDKESILRKISGAHHAASTRNTFSISAILDHLAHGLDEEQERSDTDGTPSSHDAASKAMARGTRVHRFFERWDFKSPPEDLIRQTIDEAALGLSESKQAVEDLLVLANQFQASPFGQRLAAENDIQREAPFYLSVDQTIISGTIDAILGDDTLVDYKTGRWDPDRNARYEWQLLLYAAAVEKLLGRRPKLGVLCYIDAGKTHEVTITPEQISWALKHAQEAITSMRRAVS
jgi:ATP-dependent helicase/nuclease subunit A